MLKIGVTGGIGSGKSLVCRIFEIIGVPVYFADERAKKLMNEDPGLREGIVGAFGKESYSEGHLNRQFLSEQVFSDQEKLKVLNSLVHPAVWKDMAQWFAANEHSPYVVEESAILFETGAYKNLDKTILVTAPAEIRIARTIARDKVTVEAVEARMRNQIDVEKAGSMADHIIVNDGQKPVIPQVLHIHTQLLNL